MVCDGDNLSLQKIQGPALSCTLSYAVNKIRTDTELFNLCVCVCVFVQTLPQLTELLKPTETSRGVPKERLQVLHLLLLELQGT